MKKELKQIYDKINEYENIVITAHKYPDGDAIGSAVALKKIIEKKLNKNVYIVIDFELPSYVYTLNAPKIYSSTSEIEEFSFEKSLHISVDTATYERISMKEEEINKFKECINIDHHITNEKYGNINYVLEKSSVSEMMYEILEEFDVILDDEIAKFIYLGIINDTGNFRHSNTKKSTFLVASKLVERNIDISQIYFSLFQRSLKKAKLFGNALMNFKYIEKYKFSYFFLDKKTILENKYSYEDSDGISELLLSTEGVSVSLFLREEENGKIKGSLRSKFNVNVSDIAQIFSGGGHIKASGFITDKNIDEILKIIGEYFEKL